MLFRPSAVIFVVFLALYCLPAASYSLYQCFTAEGQKVFSDIPCNKESKKVDITIAKPISRVTQHGLRPGEEKLLRQIKEKEKKKAEARPPPKQRRTRGMPFRVFRILHEGMSEGEVLFIAGPPDKETTDAINTRSGLTQKSYYYIKKGHNANVTRIQFVNGSIAIIEREIVHSRAFR